MKIVCTIDWHMIIRILACLTSFRELSIIRTVLHVNGAWSVGVVKGLKLTLLHKTTWFV